MTPTEINVAIAKECGWTFKEGFVIPYGRNKPENIWFTPDGTPCKSGRPDYYSDLNAMHGAELTMTHDEWRIFLGFMNNSRVIPHLMSMEEFHECWNATAPQRCEAFLRVRGKLKE